MATSTGKITIPSTLSASIVSAGIISAMQNAGFTLVKDWNLPSTQAGEFHAAFTPNFSYPANAKRPVIDIYVNNNNRAFNSVFYDSFNTTNNTGTNPSALSTSSAYENDKQIELTWINGVDFKGVLFFQTRSTTQLLGVMGVLKPFYKEVWWNETNHVYAFMSSLSVSNFNSFIVSGLSPLNLVSSTTVANTCQFDTDSSYANANPNTSPANQREIKRYLTLNMPTGDGLRAGSVGQCREIVTVAGNGLRFLDDFKPSPNIEEYLALSDGGIPTRAIRTIGDS